MKHILAPILLLVFLFPSLALSEEVVDYYDDLVQREGIFYKKFTDVPFTGKTTGLTQGTFKNGKRDGPWVLYYDNGGFLEKGTYKNGGYDGPWVKYHDNGQLNWKGDFKNGEKEGPWVIYYENGELRDKGDWKNGKRDGFWVWYHRDGRLWREATYENGVRIIGASPPPSTD